MSKNKKFIDYSGIVSTKYKPKSRSKSTPRYIDLICPVCDSDICFRTKSINSEEDLKCPMCNEKLNITF